MPRKPKVDKRVAKLVRILGTLFPNVELFTSSGEGHPDGPRDYDFFVNFLFDHFAEARYQLMQIVFAVQQAEIESRVLISEDAWAKVSVWVNSDCPAPETLTFMISGRFVEPDLIEDLLDRLLKGEKINPQT